MPFVLRRPIRWSRKRAGGPALLQDVWQTRRFHLERRVQFTTLLMVSEQSKKDGVEIKIDITW
jgi:hypothetical protein